MFIPTVQRGVTERPCGICQKGPLSLAFCSQKNSPLRHCVYFKCKGTFLAQVTWVFELFLLLWLWICRMARKLLPRRSSWLPLWWLNPKGLPHRDKSFEDSFSDDDTFEDSFHSLGTSLNDSRHGTTVFPHISSTPKPLRANASQRFCSTPWLDSPQRPPSRSRLSNQLEDTWFDMEPKNLFQSFEELAAESSPDL
ncbi:unnamed protein product [Ixodes persulcatus]